MARKEGASVFRGNSQKKRGREWERERKKEKKIKTRGDQASSVSKAHYFTFKRDFYTLSCTEREMKDAKSYRVSPNITSVLPLSKPQFFFLHTSPINNIVYIIFRRWRPVNIL